jgi:hypothetical protein
VASGRQIRTRCRPVFEDLHLAEQWSFAKTEVDRLRHCSIALGPLWARECSPSRTWTIPPLTLDTVPPFARPACVARRLAGIEIRHCLLLSVRVDQFSESNRWCQGAAKDEEDKSAVQIRKIICRASYTSLRKHNSREDAGRKSNGQSHPGVDRCKDRTPCNPSRLRVLLPPPCFAFAND